MPFKLSAVRFCELIEFVKANEYPPNLLPGRDNKLDVCYVSPNDHCHIWDSIEHGPIRHDYLRCEFVFDQVRPELPFPIRERISVRRYIIEGSQVRFSASTYKLSAGTAVIECRYIGNEVWYSRIIICSREEGERNPALLDSYGHYVREYEEQQPIPELVTA